MLGLCEVGGHKAGLGALGIDPQDLLEGAMPVNEFRAAANQAYMSVWHETGTGVSLKLREVPTIVPLTSLALDPQLVILDFRVTAFGHDGKEGRLVQGQLHIRSPAGKPSPTDVTKTINGRSTQSAGAEG